MNRRAKIYIYGYGDTEEEALQSAADALETALEHDDDVAAALQDVGYIEWDE